MNYLCHHTRGQMLPTCLITGDIITFHHLVKVVFPCFFSVKLLFPSFHTLWYLLILIYTSSCNQEFLWELPLCPLLMFQLVCLFLVLTDFKMLFIYKLQLSSPRESFSILTLFLMSFDIYVFNFNLIIYTNAFLYSLYILNYLWTHIHDSPIPKKSLVFLIWFMLPLCLKCPFSFLLLSKLLLIFNAINQI